MSTLASIAGPLENYGVPVRFIGNRKDAEAAVAADDKQLQTLVESHLPAGVTMKQLHDDLVNRATVRQLAAEIAKNPSRVSATDCAQLAEKHASLTNWEALRATSGPEAPNLSVGSKGEARLSWSKTAPPSSGVFPSVRYEITITPKEGADGFDLQTLSAKAKGRVDENGKNVPEQHEMRIHAQNGNYYSDMTSYGAGDSRPHNAKPVYTLASETPEFYAQQFVFAEKNTKDSSPMFEGEQVYAAHGAEFLAQACNDLGMGWNIKAGPGQ